MAIHTMVHDKVARKACHEKTLLHVDAILNCVAMNDPLCVLNIVTIDLQIVCLTKGHHPFVVVENRDQTNETNLVNARGHTDQNLVGIKLRLNTAP